MANNPVFHGPSYTAAAAKEAAREGPHPHAPHDADEGLRWLLHGQNDPAIRQLIIIAWRSCTEGVHGHALTQLGTLLKAYAERAARAEQTAMVEGVAVPQAAGVGSNGSPLPASLQRDVQLREIATSAIGRFATAKIIQQLKPALEIIGRQADLIHTAQLHVETAVQHAQQTAANIGTKIHWDWVSKRWYLRGLEVAVTFLLAFALGQYCHR